MSTATRTNTTSLAQRQFRLPRGLFGRLAGWYMAGENRRLNQMAVDWLDVAAGDDVLEIGFGPGHAIELLCAQTAAGTVTGIDPSAEMVDQAVARNQAAIDAGRTRLLLGDVVRLPIADQAFNRVVAVSNFHIWPSRADGLSEVFRVLRRGGRLVLAVRRALKRPWPWSSPGVSLAQLDRDQALLRKTGFSQVHLATRKQGRRNVCLVADK